MYYQVTMIYFDLSGAKGETDKLHRIVGSSVGVASPQYDCGNHTERWSHSETVH